MARSDPPSEPTVVAWEEGYPLSTALEEFSREPSLLTEYKRLLTYILPKLPPPDLPIPFESRNFPQSLPYDPSAVYQRFLAVREQLQHQVHGLLKSGELVALGFRCPRSVGDIPARIPNHLWEHGRVSWEESELWADHEVFEHIRVLQSPEARAAEFIAELPSATFGPRPGRPSRRNAIQQAYLRLRDEDKIDFRSLHRNFKNIRNLVRQLSQDASDIRGLGNEALRSALANQFKQDQQTRPLTENYPGKSPQN